MGNEHTSEGHDSPTRVIIAGGGVAALEAALALRKLAGDKVAITMIAPETELVYQALSVGDPFALGAAKRYPLERVGRDLRIDLRHDGLASVDTDDHTVTTSGGDSLSYDALLVAVGARRVPAYEHALTFRGQEDTEPVHALVQDLEGGYVRRVAFVVPPAVVWSLPLYELALMTAARMREMSIDDAEITVITPEESPLAVFGAKATEELAEVLGQAGISVEAGTHAEIDAPGKVRLRPGGQLLQCDRLVALPSIVGRAIAGLPSDESGFIPINAYARVTGVDDVYAAGDGTSFPVKQGGIACQQADVAARGIARQAGADVEVEPFRPVLRGQLLTGRAPFFLRHRLRGGQGEDPGLADHTLWWPPSKIVGTYLAPYLNVAPEVEQMPESREFPLDAQLLGAVGSRIVI